MNISWIVTPQFQTDADIKAIGPVWGSDITWRLFNTDNVVCFDYRRASDLIARRFHEQCNFYIPEKFFSDLNRPSSVNLVGGGFSDEVDQKEEVVAAHLVSQLSDIVLLGGFDLSPDFNNLDEYEKHRVKNFLNSIQRVIDSSGNTQWVALDHVKPIDERFSNLKNFTQDTTDNVVSMLS
jgi:hypothetical protein